MPSISECTSCNVVNSVLKEPNFDSFGFYVTGKKIHSSEAVKNVVSAVINLLSILQEQTQFPERKGAFETSSIRLVLKIL
jgi:hypothetical protein